MAFTTSFNLPEKIRSLRSENTGVSLGELADPGPVLLLFLRHLGCTFCREALNDLKSSQEQIQARGVALALVHLVEEQEASPFFDELGMAPVPRFSDPGKIIYRAFGLRQGNPLQLYGPKVVMRGVSAGLLGGLGFGRIQGDHRQMPGVFLLGNGRVLGGYLHESAADRPDYCRIIDQSLGQRE